MAPEELYTRWNSRNAAGKHPATPITSGLTFDGFKAEIWSVGVVAFELLTGHKPFPLGRKGLMTYDEYDDYLQLSSALREEELMASYLEWHEVQSHDTLRGTHVSACHDQLHHTTSDECTKSEHQQILYIQNLMMFSHQMMFNPCWVCPALLSSVQSVHVKLEDVCFAAIVCKATSGRDCTPFDSRQACFQSNLLLCLLVVAMYIPSQPVHAQAADLHIFTCICCPCRGAGRICKIAAG